MQSVRKQTYSNYIVHASYDNEETERYVVAYSGINYVQVLYPDGGQYGYNLYCNDLKNRITQGWFFFLDDDDVLASPTVLEELAPLLTGNGVIVQMNRGGRLKPANGEIERGKIGMPCLVLPAMYARLASITATEDGDYQWIKAVAEKVVLTFHPLVLVKSRWRGHGYKE